VKSPLLLISARFPPRQATCQASLIQASRSCSTIPDRLAPHHVGTSAAALGDGFRDALWQPHRLLSPWTDVQGGPAGLGARLNALPPGPGCQRPLAPAMCLRLALGEGPVGARASCSAVTRRNTELIPSRAVFPFVLYNTRCAAGQRFDLVCLRNITGMEGERSAWGSSVRGGR
jgi:hypothetical protein